MDFDEKMRRILIEDSHQTAFNYLHACFYCQLNITNEKFANNLRNQNLIEADHKFSKNKNHQYGLVWN